MNANDIPETLQEAVIYFADKQRAFEFMKALRWPDGVVQCPKCCGSGVYFMTKVERFKCRECKAQFSLKTGTVFEDSPLGLDKWLPAFWLIVNAKNGISSCEISRALSVTQKTAWFMLHRIRLALQGGTMVKTKLHGLVEVDESYIGGLARNMHAAKKREKIKGRGPNGGKHKTAVQGLLQRHIGKCSKVVAEVVLETDGETLKDNVRKYVLKGSEVHTDAHRGYCGLDEDFVHEVIDHAEAYVKDGVSTNGLENFWSLLKRTLKGTYVSVEPFHLFRYLDEQTFRFNERKHEDGDRGRFLAAMAGIIGKRLTWAKLTAENDVLPAAS